MELIPREITELVNFTHSNAIREYFDLNHTNEPPVESKEIAQMTWIKYPQEVQNELDQLDSDDHKSVFLGRFSEIGCFYCCISTTKKQTIYWWQRNNATGAEKVFHYDYNSDETIRGATIAKPSKWVYKNESIKYILIFITDKGVVLIPLKRDCSYVSEIVRKVPTSFTPNTITASAKDSNKVFIGTTNGEVYRLEHDESWIDGDSERTAAVKLSSFYNLRKGIWKTVSDIYKSHSAQPVVQQIIFDDTTSYMAVLYGRVTDGDETSTPYGEEIDFFLYNNNALELAGSSVLPYAGGKIVSISAIPKSDSLNTRFVVFTDRGDRYMFGTNSDLFDTPQTIGQRGDAIEWTGANAVGCAYALGNTVIVENDGDKTDIVLLKPTHSPYPSSRYTTEAKQVESCDVMTRGLPLSSTCVVIDTHGLTRISSEIMYHEFLWQHLLDRPRGYVFFTNEICMFEINRPVDIFKQDYADKWLMQYNKLSQPREIAACIILIRKLMKDDEDKVLDILDRFSEYRDSEDGHFNNERCCGVQGFFVRVAKMLDVFWNCPVLERIGDKWKLSYVYSDVPSEFISDVTEELCALDEFAGKYIEKINNKQFSDEKKRRRKGLDVDHLTKLREYIKEVSNALKFLRVLAKYTDKQYNDERDDTISNAVDELLESKKSVLTEPFGNDQHSRELFKALRELAAIVSKNDSTMDKILQDKCPEFYSEEDREIVNITRRLHSEGSKASELLLDDARDTYLKHISRLFNLEQAVNLLKQVKLEKSPRYIIEICLKKAEDEDRQGDAIAWYKENNRSSEDIDGRTAFDHRYHCYELCFDCIEDENALKAMFDTDDELFHICLYDYMLEKGKINDLLKQTSNFIVPFLEERSPDHVWIYHARQGQHRKAVEKLLEMCGDNKERDLADRVAWLKLAMTSSIDEDEAQKIRTKALAAEVQLELYRERLNDPGSELLSEQKLYEKCQSTRNWDLALRMLSFLPVNADNTKRNETVKTFWWYFVREQIWNEELPIARIRVKTLVDKIKQNNAEIVKPDIVIPILEEFKLNKNGNDLWVARIFVDDSTELTTDLSVQELFQVYDSGIERRDVSDDIKCQFIHAAAYIGKFSRGDITCTHDKIDKWKDFVMQWKAKNRRAATTASMDETLKLINDFEKVLRENE